MVKGFVVEAEGAGYGRMRQVSTFLSGSSAAFARVCILLRTACEALGVALCVNIDTTYLKTPIHDLKSKQCCRNSITHLL
jgi:hypothetical protein